MNRLYRITLLLASVSLSAMVTPAFAQWTHVKGPEGCDVGAVLIDSSAEGAKITISSDNGKIYVSSDTGSSWNLAGIISGGPYPDELVESHGTIFANPDSGLYSSTDQGAHWTQLMSGTFGFLYAHDSTILAGSPNSIYISGDLGATWSEIDTLFDGSTPLCFAIVDSTILVGTSNGVIASADGGSTWSTSLTNLPAGWVIMLTNIGGTLYANITTGQKGLYCSTDGGTSWQMISGDLSQDYVYSLCAANGLLYAASRNGCFVSADSGKTWSSRNAGMGAIPLVNILPLGGKLIAATTYDGVYISADGGMTWAEGNNGLPNLPIISIASNGLKVMGGTSAAGVFLSSDEGKTWLGRGLAGDSFYSLAVTGPKLFASNFEGLNISTDDGLSWTQANLNPAASQVNCIAIKGTNMFVGSNDYIYHSSDGGNTWQQTNIGFTNPSVQSVAIGKKNIYATSGGAVFVSTNDGGNWQVSGDPYIGAECLAASGNNIVLGLVENAIEVSRDNGSTWNQVLNISPDGILAFETNGSRVFAATGSGNLYTSVDFGGSWKEVPSSFQKTGISGMTVCDSSLLVASGSSGLWQCPLSYLIGNAPAVPTPDSPADSSTNLADTVNFAWSRSAGATFYTLEISYDEGFADLVQTVNSSAPTISIALPPDSSYYWHVAAFDSAGALAWSNTRSFKTGTATGLKRLVQVPKQYRLFQNYPNPFNPATTIMFQLKEPSSVKLDFYNILGQRVREVSLGELSAGKFRETIDMSQNASGVYLYRINAVGADGETFVSWKKMTLLK